MTSSVGTLGNMAYAGTSSESRVSAGTHSYTNAALGVMSDKMSATRTLYFTRTPDGVLLDERVVDSGSLTKTYYYGLDNVGSVIRITDGTGATAATYAYDPYGVQNSAEPPSRTRYDDASLGRWSQRDPSGKELILMRIRPNDPTNNVDPTGRCVYGSTDPSCLAAFGASCAGFTACSVPAYGSDVGLTSTGSYCTELVSLTTGLIVLIGGLFVPEGYFFGYGFVSLGIIDAATTAVC